jgi:NADPH:quinone reductase-like Zn-dependent oxidoreductase
VRELGADEVIDYRATRFEDAVRNVDVVFDTVGGDTQDRSWQVLKPGGILVSIVQPIPAEKAAAYGVRGVLIRQAARGDQMAAVADLVGKGRVNVLIAEVMPLSEARKAQNLSQAGHARGKIVLTID